MLNKAKNLKIRRIKLSNLEKKLSFEIKFDVCNIKHRENFNFIKEKYNVL
jgi:hypothetical protein